MHDRRQRLRFLDYLLDRPMPLAGTLAVLVAATEAAADWTTWVELDVSAVYGVPLVLAAVARNRRLLWILTACLVFMTFAAYVAQIGPGGFSPHEPYFINRVMSAAALTLLAALCHVWIVAADRLAEASARKTQLLASVSHDVRSPLATIDLIADLVLRSAGDPALAAQLPDLVRRLRNNTRSLTDLVSALVDISSLDAGRIGVRNSEFSLNEWLAEECERLLPLVQAKGLRLVMHAPEVPLWLRTDKLKLSRILSNLAGNAIKFTQTGAITISATLSAERAPLIRVEDTGAGMSPESLERIFDEYGQLGNPERDRNRGWGLGLAICRRLAGVMGGRIAVESERGRGTTFSLHLPASSCLAR